MTLKLLTGQLLYYFVLMFCIILQKMQTSVKTFCWSYVSCLYFQILQHTIVKLFDTLEIKTNSNNLLLGIFFFLIFFFAFWALHQHTKDCWKLCDVASKQGYPLICVIRDTGYSRYSFIIFCKVLLIFAKKKCYC